MQVRSLVLLGCVVAMILASPAAKAGKDGTIAFAGAVVEFTCSIEALPEGVGSTAVANQPRQHCAGAITTGTGAGTARPYLVEVAHLSDSEPDRVLRYFVTYVRAEQHDAADPVLVTQTYE